MEAFCTMHTIENEELRVMISDHGAELSGIFDKKNNREVLWNADPKYWKRHAPVLFPNVGRLYKDTCLIGGRNRKFCDTLTGSNRCNEESMAV